MNEFIKKINEYRHQLSQGVRHLGALESKCDKHFETEIVKLNDTFKSVIKEIQLCYSAIYKKLESDVSSNKTDLQRSKELSNEILGDLLTTKQDVEENFEKIVLRMDLSPFSEIMDSYGAKMKAVENSLSQLSMYECDLAQLEENKDYMNQMRNCLRSIFSLRNLNKVKHKKFNSEEVIFEGDRLPSIDEREEIAFKLRKSAESPQKSPRSQGSGTKGYWAMNVLKESLQGLDARVQQQFRKITSEMITDNLDSDKLLQNEAREFISKIDQVVHEGKQLNDHSRRISSRDHHTIQGKYCPLSKSESSPLAPTPEKQFNEYSNPPVVSILARKTSPPMTKKDQDQSSLQKISKAHSLISNKSKEEYAHRQSEDNSEKPNNGKTEKLGRFLRKHFTQSDLKSLPGKHEHPTGDSKSKLCADTQRSESRGSEIGHYHMKASLSNPPSGKKSDQREPKSQRSDYFSNLIDLKMNVIQKPAVRPSNSPLSLKEKDSNFTAPRKNQAQPQGKAIINLTKYFSPANKDQSPNRTPPPAHSAPGSTSGLLKRPDFPLAEHTSAAAKPIPRNNFLIPRHLQGSPKSPIQIHQQRNPNLIQRARTEPSSSYQGFKPPR